MNRFASQERQERRLGPAIALVLVACLAAGGTGCVKLLRKSPEKRYYVLDTTRPGAPAPAAAGAEARVLSLRRFRVSPPYDMASLVYYRGAERYESDFYDEFFLPPASMYGERAARWLEQSGLFGHVVDSASTLTPTHVLEGAVTRACGDFSRPSKPVAVLDIQFLLLDVTRAEPRVVTRKDEHVEVPLAHTTAAAVVGGLTEALRQALEGFEAQAREALEPSAAAPAPAR